MLCATALAAPQRRIALIIGNAAYGELGILRNPVNDASDMAAMLQQLKFEVTLLRDVGLRAMHEAVDTFSRQLRQDGVGLFYFAGHGVQVNGENYLIPLRANITREQDVFYEAMPVGRVLGGMEDAANQFNIVILDACRDNPYARQWRSVQRGLATMQAGRGSLIAYATAPGSAAIDGSGRNGIYTSSLLKYLPTPGLSVEQLFKKVRVEVIAATRNKQTPWESSSLVGDFTFVPEAPSSVPAVVSPLPPSAQAPVAPNPVGPDPEVVTWGLIEKSNEIEDFRAFLQEYPQGRFTPAARVRLQQLQRLANQQRPEQQRLTAQERQRLEREEAAARQQAEEQRVTAQERQRREREEAEARQRTGAQRRREQAPQPAQSTTTPQPLQVTRLEPEQSKREEKVGRFIKYDNGTALDTKTNLMWMTKDFRNIEERAPEDGNEALAWVEKMNRQRYGGYNDWRVPTSEEYKTTYETNKSKITYEREPVGYPEVFEDGGGELFWSNELAGQLIDSIENMRFKRTLRVYTFSFKSGRISPRNTGEGQSHYSIRLVR
jgi:uncharacterized caspase-like protein